MIKATLLLKRRARVALLGQQALNDGHLHKEAQAKYIMQKIDEIILGLSSEKPYQWQR